MRPYYESGNGITLFHGDVMTVLCELPAQSVDCVVTSPPYWYKRDYDFPGQWGLEPTFQEYLEKMWALMDEVHRVLKDTGTCWVNLGDTYVKNGTPGGTKYVQKDGGNRVPHMKKQTVALKSLCHIPHRFAIGCVDRGWICRNDILWNKPNGMAESVQDRFNVKNEYLFLLVKGKDYYFDLESVKEPTVWKRSGYRMGGKKHREAVGHKGVYVDKGTKNPGNVWNINTKASSSEHIATFNPEIPERCIKAGCPPAGTVLDIFCGVGTTIKVAFKLDRKGIGIDGNPHYLDEAIGKRNPIFDNYGNPSNGNATMGAA